MIKYAGVGTHEKKQIKMYYHQSNSKGSFLFCNTYVYGKREEFR